LGQRAGLLLLPGPPGEHRGDAGDPRDHAARVSLGGGREERSPDDPVNALLAASPAPYETGSKRIEKAVRQAPPISRSSFIAGRAWGLGSYENGAASPPSRSPASPSSQALAASWTAGASRHRSTEARSSSRRLRKSSAARSTAARYCRPSRRRRATSAPSARDFAAAAATISRALSLASLSSDSASCWAASLTSAAVCFARARSSSICASVREYSASSASSSWIRWRRRS